MYCLEKIRVFSVISTVDIEYHQNDTLVWREQKGVPIMAEKRDGSRSVTQARQFIDYILQRQGVLLASVPELCIISYNDSLIEKIRSLSTYRTIGLGLTTRTELTILEPGDLPAVGLIRGQHGASMSAVLLEELIALGFGHFLTVGAAGHPQYKSRSRACIGDLIMPTAALVHEGTSKHYGQVANVVSAESSGTSLLQKVLHSLEIPYKAGLAATTDGFYRETPAFLRDLEDQGVMALEMELSALLTVGAYYGKSVASILYITDVLEGDSGCWRVGLADDFLEGLVERLVAIARAYARELQAAGI